MKAHFESVARSPALISRAGLWTLAALAALAAAAFLPLAFKRATEAGQEKPSALALTYLRLRVAEDPSQLDPRLELSDAARQLGLLNEARAVLAPFRDRAGTQGRVARERLVQIERAAWAAVPASYQASRDRKLEAYRGALHAVRPQELDAGQIESLAGLAREAGETRMVADLLGSLAMRPGKPDRKLIQAAERAYLEDRRPLEAARLLADFAAYSGDTQAGLRSLAHARSAAKPDAAWQIFKRLEHRLRNVPMLEQGLLIAQDAGDQKSAFAIAERLLAGEPSSKERHLRVLELSTWNGDAQRALVEQLWLLEHGGGGRDAYLGVERSARALSDLRTMRKLYERRDAAQVGHNEVVQLMAVYDALGESDRAMELLKRALRGKLRDDYELWNMRYRRERAAGQLEQVLDTLAELDTVFEKTLETGELRADLLMKLGRVSEALGVLADVTPQQDHERLSRLGALAWASSNTRVARRAYLAASQLPQTTQDDFFRLYQLEMLDGNTRAAAEVTLRGLDRFDTLGMLELALGAALAAEDGPTLEMLIARSERPGHPFRNDPRYVRLRVSYRQRRAAVAIAHGQLFEAGMWLAASGEDLSRGLSSKPTGPLVQLKSSQYSQELALALARDDKASLHRLYPLVANTLSPRERVHLLHRMDRDNEALASALDTLKKDEQLTPTDRKDLQKDADALAWQRPRTASATLEVTDMGPLKLWGARAQTTYTSKSGHIFSGGVQYIQLDAEGPASIDRKHELIPWAGLREIWNKHEAGVAVGVDLRNGVSPRPFLTADGRFQLGAPALSVSARVDEVGNDTAALRVLGLRDVLAAGVEMPFTEKLYGNASAAGSLYSTRDRDLVGAGLTVEGALGWKFFPAESALQSNIRLATRVAPRWGINDLPANYGREIGMWDNAAGGFMPDSTTWLGVGGTLAKGDLGLPPVYGRDVKFIVDGSVGWLFPQQSVGFSARAGVGTSVVGGDMLSVSARAGNVVGTSPTNAVYSVQVDYSIGLWR